MRWLIVPLVSAGLLLAAACGGDSEAPASPGVESPGSPTAAPATASPAPAPADPFADVENQEFAEQQLGDGVLFSSGETGEPVRVGTLVIIVHGLTEAPDQCSTAAEPDIVLLDADVELQNVSQKTQLNFFTSNSFLADTKAIQHRTAAYTCSGSPYLDQSTVPLAPGQSVRGTIPFDVLETLNVVKFRYQVEFSGKVGRWDVNVQR